MSKIFTAAEVAAHKTPQDLYIIVDGDVYDLTKFQDDHPGSSFPFYPPLHCSFPATFAKLSLPCLGQLRPTLK